MKQTIIEYTSGYGKFMDRPFIRGRITQGIKAAVGRRVEFYIDPSSLANLAANLGDLVTAQEIRDYYHSQSDPDKADCRYLLAFIRSGVPGVSHTMTGAGKWVAQTAFADRSWLYEAAVQAHAQQVFLCRFSDEDPGA